MAVMKIVEMKGNLRAVLARLEAMDDMAPTASQLDAEVWDAIFVQVQQVETEALHRRRALMPGAPYTPVSQTEDVVVEEE